MKKIPIRHIKTTQKEPGFSGSFSIRDVRDLLAGKDMVQELHRHDFFYILVLKKGKGDHAIDFTSYKVCDNAVFFLRPGQVHQLTLKAGSTGYLMGFKTDFYLLMTSYQISYCARQVARTFISSMTAGSKRCFPY
jgi:AraC family transcriptional regulator, transcriptional activator of pobA